MPRAGSSQIARMAAPHIRLLQQHPGCVILYKPPGVPFHATAGQPGLLQLVRRQQGQAHLPYEGPLWPVHRLDLVTSGPLVLATSPEAAGELVARFRSRGVQKYYVALSDRRPSKKMGSVVGDMQKGRRGSWMLARSSRNPTVTRFVSTAVEGAAEADESAGGGLEGCLAAGGGADDFGERAQDERQQQQQQAQGEQQEQGQQQQARQQQPSGQQQGRPPSLRAFLLKPETGRTHQLRVALKSLGAPILGDERYGLKEAAAVQDRAYLHCAALRFQLGGRPVQVVCPPRHGRHFLAGGFRRQFGLWFPPGMEHDTGAWFADSKLLKSEALSPAGAGAAAGEWAADAEPGWWEE